MIQHIDDQGLGSGTTTGGTHRVLAVVAGEEARAAEVARRFAAEGDEVETLWYQDVKQLRAKGEERKDEFEVVILFSDAQSSWQAAEAEAQALRRWLGNTPLIEAA